MLLMYLAVNLIKRSSIPHWMPFPCTLIVSAQMDLTIWCFPLRLCIYITINGDSRCHAETNLKLVWHPSRISGISLFLFHQKMSGELHWSTQTLSINSSNFSILPYRDQESSSLALNINQSNKLPVCNCIV